MSDHKPDDHLEMWRSLHRIGRAASSAPRTRVIHIANATGAPDEVYVGRAGHGLDGYFGNPVVIGERCPVCAEVHVEKGDTIPCFWRYAEARMKDDPTFAARVRELRGKTLLCFCKPKPCHGDVLARFADGQ